MKIKAFCNEGISGVCNLILVNSGLKRIEAHQFYEKQSFYKKGYSFYKWIK